MAARTSDVVDLILADHRRCEQLFAVLRDATSDRVAARSGMTKHQLIQSLTA